MLTIKIIISIMIEIYAEIMGGFMKKGILMLLLLMVMLAVDLIAFSSCSRDNIYPFTYDGKTYEVVKEQMTWANAAAYAVSRGGYLVEINSLAEQNAVYDAIINGAAVSPTYTSVSNGGGIAYVWIGASDQNEEGVWLWDGNNDNTGIHFWSGQGSNGAGDGSAVNGLYNNWGGTSLGVCHEPDNWNNDQNYAAMGLAGWPSGTTNLGSPGEWNDIMGASPLYFVIEYSGPTGTNQITEDSQLKYSCYPNPTNSVLRFNRPDLIQAVEVYNIKGQLILKSLKRELDFSRYQKGLYLIKILGNEHNQVLKVIVR